MDKKPTFELPEERKSGLSPETTIEEGIIDDPEGEWWKKLPAGLEPKDVETWVEWVEADRKYVSHWCKKGKRKEIPRLDWQGR